jgi:very-short-patch-repair endonuclease
MTDILPPRLQSYAKLHGGVVTRKQAIKAGMSRHAIEWRLQAGRWQQAYRGVYATFTGPLDRTARLWAAVLYAGRGAVLSYETAGELQKLVDKPAPVIHLTVPANRRVTQVKGLVIHVSDQGWRLPFPHGVLPATLPEDTIIDLAESADDVDDVYGWVTRAFGRDITGDVKMRIAIGRRIRLRWRSELEEAIAAGAGGAHSALELRWDRDVEQAHGLPAARRQVRFRKQSGSSGYRDRVYAEYGVIIELDGKKAHPEEARGRDRARDNAAAAEGHGQTLRYGWKDVRYEPCQTTVQTVRVLWRRGWRGRPTPCSPACPVARLLQDLDTRLAALPEARRRAAGWAVRAAS